MDIHFWVHSGEFGDREEAVLDILSRYPCDVQIAPIRMPGYFEGPEDDPSYRWLPYDDPWAGREVAHDARVAVEDWGRLDEIVEKFPKADYPGLLADFPEPDGRYRLAHWFFFYFERHWSFRGMTNALLDYYTHADEVHRLFRTLTDFYVGIVDHAGRERNCDGLWLGDDLGTQTAAFFSLDIFREFFKPYYKEVFDKAHEHGMDVWLHSCGNVAEFVPEWIEIGLNVLHPIQKHAMDERRIAANYGDRLTLLAGLDVQQVIPWGTPQEVRDEVRFLIDTYWRPGEGRLILSAGNGINGDCTLEALEAFLDEAYTYGAQVVRDAALA